jgi:hypothetical protein
MQRQRASTPLSRSLNKRIADPTWLKSCDRPSVSAAVSSRIA